MSVLRDLLRLMVGKPPYEVYLAHMAQRRSETKPMTRVEFFCNRENAPFSGAGPGKCC
jgi:uncharacterized short protein YbdD (DUF466 family)